MVRNWNHMREFLFLLVCFIVFGAFAGCNRDQQTQSPQTSAPAVAVPQAQTPATSSSTPAPAAAPTMSPPAAQSTSPATVPTTPSPQNANQVQVGMTSQQVLQIMGNPSRIKQEGQMVEWEYYTAQGKFEVRLQNDAVAYISRH